MRIDRNFYKKKNPLIILTLQALIAVGIFVTSCSADSGPVELIRDGEVFLTSNTIQGAIESSTAGDTILIHEGIYYETLTISSKNGTADSNIVLMGAEDEEVVIDLADPELQQPGNSRWTHLGDGKYEATVEWNGTDWRALNNWVTLSDETLLASHSSLDKLDDLPRGDASIRGDGIFMPSNKIIVKFEDKQDPSTMGVNVALHEFGIEFNESAYWTVKNITIKHAGFAGIYLYDRDCHNVTFDHVTIQSSSKGISTHDFRPEKNDNVTDENWYGPANITITNTKIINDLGAHKGWSPWYSYKDDREDYPVGNGDSPGKPSHGFGITLYNTPNAEVAYCEIDGQWDGAAIWGDNVKFHHNLIRNCTDDAVELEGWERENMEFYNNFIYDCWTGISIGPNPVGPMYIYRNIVLTTQTFDGQVGRSIKFGVKFGGNTLEDTKVYHNTFYATDNGEIWRTWEPDSDIHEYTDMEFINNIFYYNGEGTGLINTEGIRFPCDQGNLFNGNAYSKRSGLQYMQECDGWETTGYVISNPFVNITSDFPNVTLNNEAHIIDQGLSYVKNKGWPDNIQIEDGAPDVGSLEKGIAFEPVGVEGKFTYGK